MKGIKNIFVIKKIMFDGTEVAIDSALSIKEAEDKWTKYFDEGLKVNCYELTGKEKVRIQF